MADGNVLLPGEQRVATDARSRTVSTGVTQIEHALKVTHMGVGAQPLPFARFLANGSSIELAEDASLTEHEFTLAPGADEILRVTGMTALIRTASLPTFDTFGDLAALTDGVAIDVLDKDGEVAVDLTAGVPIRSNGDLAQLGVLSMVSFAATYAIKWELGLGAAAIRLAATSGYTLRVKTSDNLEALALFRVLATGVEEGSLA